MPRRIAIGLMLALLSSGRAMEADERPDCRLTGGRNFTDGRHRSGDWAPHGDGMGSEELEVPVQGFFLDLVIDVLGRQCHDRVEVIKG